MLSFNKVLILIFISISTSSCDSIVGRADRGQCWRHKWESGLWLVKKVDETQIVLEQIPEKNEESSMGKIKVVGQLYGGWYQSECPEKYRSWIAPQKD